MVNVNTTQTLSPSDGIHTLYDGNQVVSVFVEPLLTKDGEGLFIEFTETDEETTYIPWNMVVDVFPNVVELLKEQGVEV